MLMQQRGLALSSPVETSNSEPGNVPADEKSPLLVHLELTPDFTPFRWWRRKVWGQFERKPSDSVSISVFECMRVRPSCVFLVSVSIWLYSCVCVCVLLHCCCYCCCCCCYCYYCCYCCFSCPTPPPHTPHTPSPLSFCPSCPLNHPKLEGEKSDPLQSKAQVLRQNVVLFPIRPILNHFHFVTQKWGWVSCEKIVLTLLPLTVRTCFKPAFLSSFPSFFLLFSRLVLSAQS